MPIGPADERLAQWAEEVHAVYAAAVAKVAALTVQGTDDERRAARQAYEEQLSALCQPFAGCRQGCVKVLKSGYR